MKIKEIRELDQSAAREKIAELRAELARERSLIASGTRPEKPGKARKTKKTIARLFTVIREKELAEKNKGNARATGSLKKTGKEKKGVGKRG